MYTSTDSSVISPPVRHTPVEPMPDHREINIPPTPYQSSRPPSVGPSTRGYPYTSKSFIGEEKNQFEYFVFN